MANLAGFADFEGNVSLPNIEINTSGVFSELWKSMPPELVQKISSLMDIGKIVLIVLLIYFLIKIILLLMKLRDSSNLSVIATNVKEINSKVDSILHKKKIEKN